MHILPSIITGNWTTREVKINGRSITTAGFVRDLKITELELGDNRDILTECRWVRRFRWGDTSRATYCLALACCFYLNLSWVMDRFFIQELERAQQADLQLEYDEAELQAAYEQCEDMFAHEFETFMGELGAVRLKEK